MAEPKGSSPGAQSPPSKPANEISARPAETASKQQRKNAASAEVGMVPINSEETRPSQTEDSASPAPKPLTPQARKQQKLQTQLERAIAQAFPDGKRPASLIADLSSTASSQRLRITLSNSWYQLSPTAQDDIAAALWSQKGPLKLKDIQLQDTQGKTVARRPVVGDQMVILRR